MRYFLLFLIILPMTSCSSPEEKAQREAQKEITECTAAGYKPDTPAFDECKLQVKERDDQRMADRIAAGNNAGQFQSDRSGNNGSSPSGYSIPMR